MRARVELVAVKNFFAVVTIEALIVTLLPAFTTRLIFLIARARIGKHTEIMVGKLEVIFGQHAVARLLGIARKRFVFLEQLRSVPTRPVVDPVAIILIATSAAVAALWRTLIATAATATVLLTIVDQDVVVLSKRVTKFPLDPVLAVVSEPPDDQPLRQTPRTIARSRVLDGGK